MHNMSCGILWWLPQARIPTENDEVEVVLRLSDLEIRDRRNRRKVRVGGIRVGDSSAQTSFWGTLIPHSHAGVATSSMSFSAAVANTPTTTRHNPYYSCPGCLQASRMSQDVPIMF